MQYSFLIMKMHVNVFVLIVTNKSISFIVLIVVLNG